MVHSRRSIAPIGVSTKPGDFHAVHLGISIPRAREALDVLLNTGQAEVRNSALVPGDTPSINTMGQDPDRSRALKAAWFREATERMVAGSPGLFGYSLFAISRADMVRVRQLQLDFVRAMQGIIRQSSPSECVGLHCLQLLDLRTDAQNALLDIARTTPRLPRKPPRTSG